MNGCRNSDLHFITVNPLPTVTANSSAASVCAGGTISLTGGGAVSYVWSDGPGNTIPFSPSVTTIYTATGTDANGCQNTAQVSVTVFPSPIISAGSSNSTICEGESAILTATSAVSLQWSTGSNSPSITITPTSTIQYTVTGTDALGCSKSVVITQQVDPCAGINPEEKNVGVVSIYPNPNNGEFIVCFSSLPVNAKIKIYSAIGALIYEAEIVNEKSFFDLKEFADGIYFLRILQNDKLLGQEKIVKAE